jgi:hypothetical protein
MGIARIVLLVSSGALASCATRPAPQPGLDARALCQQLTQASASSPALISKDYFDNCMIAHGSGSQIGPTKSP